MKHIEVPDFHFSPAWAELSKSIGQAVAKAAKENEVDFIAVPGDFFNAPIYASEKGGVKAAKEIIQSWLDVCPVVAIEGTPSHDAPGCYEIFKEMGLVLLEPNKVYGYHAGLKGTPVTRDPYVFEIRKDLPLVAHPSALLFGVPEPNKKTIQAKLGLSAEEANAKATDLLADYFAKFIGPNREKFPDIPAIGLIHGNIVDAHRENLDDVVMKASDVLMRTEDMRAANLDRWAAGHIHKPWESSVISCGYSGFTGIDSNPWGKTGFVPGMNLVTIATRGVGVKEGRAMGLMCNDVSRIPYGTPERRKVKSLEDITNESNVAWWVETKDRDAVLPKGLHTWSRLTIKEEVKETRRASTEDVKSLWDLFLLIDPNIDPALKSKVDKITETVKPVSIEEKNVAVTSVEISSCKLFKGKKVKFNLSGLAQGLTLLKGDNGDGKSSILSFCTPYPSIIGKDKGGTLKNFFNGKDSYIKKTVQFNGEEHEHYITIKAAHTKSAKVECYLTINGQPTLDKGSFAEMEAACNKLYGSLEDYKITTFCEQPNQAVSNQSGLMSAKPIDARNVVQAIAGLGREREKRFALDLVGECKEAGERLLLKADTIEESIVSVENIDLRLKDSLILLDFISSKLDAARADKGRAIESEKKAQLAVDDYNKAIVLESEIKVAKEEKAKLLQEIDSLSTNRDKIAKDNQAKEEIREIEVVENRNRDKQLEYSKLENDYLVKKSSSDHINEVLVNRKGRIAEAIELDQGKICTIDIDNLKKRVETAEITEEVKRIEAKEKDLKEKLVSLDLPCEHCGKVSSSAAGSIAKIKEELDQITAIVAKKQFLIDDTIDVFTAKMELSNAERLVKESGEAAKRIESNTLEVKTLEKEIELIVLPVPPVAPVLELVADKPTVMQSFERGAIEGSIRKAETSGAVIERLEKEIENKSGEHLILDADQEVIQRLAGIRSQLVAINLSVESAITNHERAKNEVEQINKEKLNRDAQVKEVERLRAEADKTGLTDWQYIAELLQPAKIPALELEMFLDIIDTEATNALDPFMEGRYAIETRTQDLGQKSLVDRFDITVHDREEGTELSLFSYNPGHKAFFSDAYIKALILQRNNRLKRSYSPVIFDEADAPIKESRIGTYYRINQAYYEGQSSKVLVVSQKDSAVNYMSNEINVNDLKE